MDLKKKPKVFLVECFILLRNYLTLFCEIEAEMTAVSDVTQSFILLKLWSVNRPSLLASRPKSFFIQRIV